jgi:hypothetical protein
MHSPRADYGVRLALLSRRCCDFVPRRTGCRAGPIFIHRNRGQLCGQPGFAAARLQHRRDARQIAEELSREKPFHINDLLHPRAACEGISVVSASIGAAVELSGRSSRGFADD